MRRILMIGVLLAPLACGGTGDTAQNESGDAADAAAPAECAVLTEADVNAVTNAGVHRIDRDPSIGAGGDCVNFASADNQPYLGVNRYTSAADFESAVNAVPSDLYPTREPVPALGDEAILLEGEGGLRYLVARQGEKVVVLFPLGAGLAMSNDQLRQLAERALAAAG